MAFDITFKEFTTPDFNKTLRRIWQEKRDHDTVEIYRIKRLVDKLMTWQKVFHDKRVELEEKYKGLGVTPENEAAFKKDMIELGDEKITVDWHNLKVEDLAGVSLSAMEIHSIEPLLEEGALEKMYNDKDNKAPSLSQIIKPVEPLITP